MRDRAAFFRLEGAISPLGATDGASWIAARAPAVRRRVLGLTGIALCRALAERDPALTGRLAWSMLRGFSLDRIEVCGEDFARERVLASMAPEVRALLEDCRRQGHALVLIAESIDAIARPVADALGMDVVLANALEFEGGAATGALREPIVGAEVDPRLLRELAARHGFDLERSRAYAGRRGDGLLLSLVGLPCAVDPDRELARLARDLDWPVLHTGARTRRRAAR